MEHIMIYIFWTNINSFYFIRTDWRARGCRVQRKAGQGRGKPRERSDLEGEEERGGGRQETGSERGRKLPT